MPEPVSSGLGRNGPWLQNAWMRVETRLDDASIAPVALAGAFRPTERATAYVQGRFTEKVCAPPAKGRKGWERARRLWRYSNSITT